LSIFLSLRQSLISSFVIGLLICAFSIVAAEGKEARIEEIVVTNTRDHLLLYFTVKDCFTEEMKSAIENGINTTFTFYVKLYEVRSLWLDREIADIKISHEVQYDSLKKLYMVKATGKSDRMVGVKDFDEVKTLMSEVVGLKVTELINLRRGARYQMQMMAELDKIRLPFYLHYVFFFLSLWDFETDWYTVDFVY